LAYACLFNSTFQIQGADLQKRSVPLPVLPRKEVLPYAYQLVRGIAEKPRISLVTLKAHMVRAIKADLDETIKLEIEMHKKTFHRPEVPAKIEKMFEDYKTST
jgi:polyketide biosynthesis enoyl-CoA hydratase PksI